MDSLLPPHAHPTPKPHPDLLGSARMGEHSHLSDRSCWARAMAVGSQESSWMRAVPSQAQAEFTSHFLLCASGRFLKLGVSPGAAFEEVLPSPASLEPP